MYTHTHLYTSTPVNLYTCLITQTPIHKPIHIPNIHTYTLNSMQLASTDFKDYGGKFKAVSTRPRDVKDHYMNMGTRDGKDDKPDAGLLREYVLGLIELCHGYRISHRVVRWRANAGLLPSYPTIYNITSIILIY